jgi:succinate dehydrogenase / fumarate reductase, cytochrome b subunit
MAVSTSDQYNVAPGAGLVPGSERTFWYFLRISGLVLMVFVLIHLFLTHYVTVPSETNFNYVAAKWANPLWRTFSIILLLSAVWHGIIGLRMVVIDIFRNRLHRQIAVALCWITGIAFTVLGMVTVLAFDEEAARNNTGPLADALWIGDAIGYSLFIFAGAMYVAVILLAVWVIQNLRNDRAVIYNGDVGQWAWILHRATGVGLVFFLLVHVFDIMLVGIGSDVYDHTVAFYANWFIIPMEIMLVGAVIYHTLNGLRVMAVNFTEKGPVKEAKAFWWVLVATVILTIPSAIVILLHEL